jgi:branched-chain amino acid transport system ATP-binding protein
VRSPEDELSLGMALLVVDRLLRVIRDAADAGMGLLLIERHVRKILDVADHAYVLQRGRLGASGPCEDLKARLDEIEVMYFA